MSMDSVKINKIFGYSEVKTLLKFEDGVMNNYSYKINYDRKGSEKGRTKPILMSTIGWDDGKPFTEKDYEELEFKSI